MSEDPLAVAIEARELGKSAHKRLDGINGQIGRLNDKFDVIASKLDTVLIAMARQEGEDRGANNVRHSALDSKRWLIGIGVTFFCSGTFTLAVTYFWRH